MQPVELGAAGGDPGAGRRARLLPAAGVDHPDDRADHPAAAQGRRLRPDLVRRRHDHRHGDGADPSAGRPQHLRHQEHRAGHPLARHHLGHAAVRALMMFVAVFPPLSASPVSRPGWPTRDGPQDERLVLQRPPHDDLGSRPGPDRPFPRRRACAGKRRRYRQALGRAALAARRGLGRRACADHPRPLREPAAARTASLSSFSVAGRFRLRRGGDRGTRSTAYRKTPIAGGGACAPRGCRAAPPGTDPPAQPRARRHARRSCACARTSSTCSRRFAPSVPTLAVAVESSTDFVHLFSSWFNRGFLVLRRIDWTTPANILEKIIRYEAVHEIPDWDDLRRRLEPPDRRCFAFFHPQLVDEPLIFVEVALTTEIPGAIAPLLDAERDADPRPGRDDGGVLFDLELPERACRRLLRQFPHQAGGRGAEAARCRASRPSSRCRRCRASPRWLARERQERRADRHPDRGPPSFCGSLDEPDWLARPGDAPRRVRKPLLSAARLLFPARQDRDGPARRSGGALPSRQRRAARAAQFPRRHRRRRASSSRTA